MRVDFEFTRLLSRLFRYKESQEVLLTIFPPSPHNLFSTICSLHGKTHDISSKLIRWEICNTLKTASMSSMVM